MPHESTQNTMLNLASSVRSNRLNRNSDRADLCQSTLDGLIKIYPEAWRLLNESHGIDVSQ